MSPAQTRSTCPISSTAKRRPNTFGATGGVWRESVVTRKRRGRFAARPSARLRRATRFLPTRVPYARSSACTRGAPYVRRLAACPARISAASRTATAARALAGRPRQA
jgi:hypothetical protein